MLLNVLLVLRRYLDEAKVTCSWESSDEKPQPLRGAPVELSGDRNARRQLGCICNYSLPLGSPAPIHLSQTDLDATGGQSYADL